jgi:SAM-dependent methyltransferase
VRFVARNYYGVANRSTIRILDLGCGPGCIIWYLAREGFDAYGIDGSKVGLSLARQRLEREGLRGEFVQGDFTLGLPFPEEFFDATIDNASLCHNHPEAISRTVLELHRVLKPVGRHFGMMFAPGCTGEGSGQCIGRNAYVDVDTGPLAGPWPIVFADQEQLRDLFKPFPSLVIDRQSYSERSQLIAVNHWLVTATKKV